MTPIYIITLHTKDEHIQLATVLDKDLAWKFKWFYRIYLLQKGERVTIRKEFIK